MIFNIITLFPHFFDSPFNTSLIKKGIEKGLLNFNIVNLRDFTTDKHKQCDDKPYGGGVGMVMMLEPIYKAIKAIKSKYSKSRIIYLSPQGKIFNDNKAESMSKIENITLLCGHYDGVDYRVVEHLIDEEISIGDFVLTGGEIAALVLIDAISRYIPGVVQKDNSVQSDTFKNYLLKYPQYTKPADFMNMKVPEILLSGNHKNISEWRYNKSIEITKKKRKDLYKKFIKERCKGEPYNKRD